MNFVTMEQACVLLTLIHKLEQASVRSTGLLWPAAAGVSGPRFRVSRQLARLCSHGMHCRSGPLLFQGVVGDMRKQRSSLAVQSLGKTFAWARALAALERVVAQVPAAGAGYNIAMDGCRRSQNWQMTICILERMTAKRLADVVSFNTAISACTPVEGASISLLRRMQVDRLQPDAISFAAAASACEIHAEWERAVHLMGQPLQPNIFLFTSVLGACGRAKQWQRALHILVNMSRHEVELSTVAINATLSVCGQARQWQIAMAMLPLIKQHRLAPSSASFGAAVNACGRVRLWRQVLAILALMRGSSLRANSWILHGAAWACNRARHWEHAAQLQTAPLVDWQVAMDLFARRTFCNDALRALCRLGKPSLCLRLLGNAEKSRFPVHAPNSPNLISLVAGLEASRLSASNPIPLAVPVARSLRTVLNQRRSTWVFVDDAMDYGGNAVSAIDFLHSIRPCLPFLQIFHGSLFRAVLSDLSASRDARRSLHHERILERQFSLGSYFTSPALGQLGLVFCRKPSASTLPSCVLILVCDKLSKTT